MISSVFCNPVSFTMGINGENNAPQTDFIK